MIAHKDMPKLIYLQIEDGVGEFDELGEATWCVDKINDSDIEYMLVDKNFRRMLDNLIEGERK